MSNNLTAAKNALDIFVSSGNNIKYQKIPMTLDIQLDNLGTVNKNLVTMTINSNKLELWFSYRTIVAFSKNGKTHCIKNQWGPTTGKLLNDICPNKSDRLSEIKFAEELNKLLII